MELHEAVEEGDIEAVKKALAAGADVNAKDEGWTSLAHATSQGHKEIAELLIAEGADVNAKEKEGWTPLFHASYDGHQEIVELLIGKGADVNAKDSEGNTALDKAEAVTVDHSSEDKAAKQEIANLLRKHGGKSGVEDSIHVAIRLKNIEAVKQHLTAGVDVNAKDEEWSGFTPLHFAASNGHKQVAELLIANGADMNAMDDDGETPLDRAIDRKHSETADLLRKHGGKHGTIHGAVGGGDVEAVKEFLAAGADVNAKDKYGRTTLHQATEGGFAGLKLRIISAGSALLERDELAFALRKEVVELLIVKGADVNAKNDDGETPLDLAEVDVDYLEGQVRDIREVEESSKVKAAKQEIADILREHGGKTGEELKAEGK